MMRNLSGSPILSILFVVFFISGPMLIAISGELSSSPESIFNKDFIKAVVPGDIFVYGIALAVIFSTRFIEHVAGSIKVIFVILITYAFDVGARVLFRQLSNYPVYGSGPFSLMTSLLCLYCIMFPSIRSDVIAFNVKSLLLFLIVLLTLMNGASTFLPVVCGFITFIFISPLFVPVVDKEEKAN